jgi:hypothetical protein
MVVGDRQERADNDPRERGDHPSYWISVIVIGAVICFFLFLYHKLDPVLVDLWGTRSGGDLDEYRAWGAKIWRLLYRCTSSWTCLWLPILWVFSAFLIQSGLRKDRARVFNKAHTVLIVVVSLIAAVSFIHLFLLPLGMWRS